MQRYEFFNDVILKNDKGEWVKYDDHGAEISALKHDLERQYKALCEYEEENARLKTEIESIKANGVCRINNTWQSWSSAEYKFNQMKSDVEKLRGFAKKTIWIDTDLIGVSVIDAWAKKFGLQDSDGNDTKLLTGESNAESKDSPV